MKLGTKTMANDTAVRTASGGDERRENFLVRWQRFLKDVRTEMRKVTTPSLKQVQATTMVVIITVFLFAVYFYGVDTIIGTIVDAIFKKVSS
jgi:preprotein translocase subunit SecE